MDDPHLQLAFAGIVVQEFSPAEQRLVGERRVIFSGRRSVSRKVRTSTSAAATTI
jgi:hypothetical protein